MRRRVFLKALTSAIAIGTLDLRWCLKFFHKRGTLYSLPQSRIVHCKDIYGCVDFENDTLSVSLMETYDAVLRELYLPAIKEWLNEEVKLNGFKR